MLVMSNSQTADDTRYYCIGSVSRVQAVLSQLTNMVGGGTYSIDGVRVEVEECDEEIVITLTGQTSHARDLVWKKIQATA